MAELTPSPTLGRRAAKSAVGQRGDEAKQEMCR
jgi:hypothetical protein